MGEPLDIAQDPTPCERCGVCYSSKMRVRYGGGWIIVHLCVACQAPYLRARRRGVTGSAGGGR